MSLRVGVIGGSIAGCAAGAVLAAAGIEVNIFERSASRLDDRGAGVALPVALVEALEATGLFDAGVHGVRSTQCMWAVQEGDSRLGRVLGVDGFEADQHHWGVVFANLRSRVPDAAYRSGAEFVELRSDDDGITARFTDGTTESFDLLVGADGANSLVRQFVAPGRHPTYAGYPAWRGIVDEAAVDSSPLEGTIHGIFLDHALAVFYLVPGRGGDLRDGRRGLNWLVYDGNEGPFSAEVHDIAPATNGRVRSIPPGGLSPAQVDYIRHDIASALPGWHRDVIFATEEPYAQALYDLSLESYVRDRVCLIGDAATVARPHTGSGATKAIQDAVALGRALGSHRSVEAALRTFDDERRTVGNSLVQLGKQLGAQLVTDVPRWQELDRTSFVEWMDRSASRSTYMLRKPTE